MEILKKGPGKGGGSSRRWTEQEDNIVKEFYPEFGGSGKGGCIERLAAIGLPRTRSAIKSRSTKLGVSYDGPLKTQFYKGMTAHNKGKPMSAETYAKCKSTMFKKGQKIYNEKDIGDLRRQQDNTGRFYWLIKIANQDWRLLHRELYVKAYGIQLSKDDIVRFKDGNTDNLEIENLELISKRENMLRNSPMAKYPPEVAKLIFLVNKLNRKLNEKSRK